MGGGRLARIFDRLPGKAVAGERATLGGNCHCQRIHDVLEDSNDSPLRLKQLNFTCGSRRNSSKPPHARAHAGLFAFPTPSTIRSYYSRSIFCIRNAWQPQAASRFCSPRACAVVFFSKVRLVHYFSRVLYSS